MMVVSLLHWQVRRLLMALTAFSGELFCSYWVRYQFAAECGLDDGRAERYLAHLVAKSIGLDVGLGAVLPSGLAELAQLRELIIERGAHPNPKVILIQVDHTSRLHS